MHLTRYAAVLATTLLIASGVAHGQKADNVIDARSLALTRLGDASAAAGNFEAANDALETAISVDPRNRAAFISLARVASRQGLNGKAIRLYREALGLDPNDVNALAGQGAALAARGAITKAQENLAKVKRICGAAACPQASELSAAIARGPTSSQQANAGTSTTPVKN